MIERSVEVRPQPAGVQDDHAHGHQIERDFTAVIRDEASFRAWYETALPRVYRYLVARCGGDVALAEELTQETFVEAIRHADRYDGRADPVTWLIAIGRNKLVNTIGGSAATCVATNASGRAEAHTRPMPAGAGSRSEMLSNEPSSTCRPISVWRSWFSTSTASRCARWRASSADPRRPPSRCFPELATAFAVRAEA